MVKLSIELVPDEPVERIVEYSVTAEEAGFDYIWITDHYNNRNLWCTLTAIALATKTVLIGPGVTNPYHTSPALSAAAAVTLNEISHGRAVIGLGAGDKVTLQTLGIEWEKPVSTVVEGIQCIRELTQGKRVTMEGRVLKLNGAKLSMVEKIPVLDIDGNPIARDGKIVKKAPKIPVYAGVQGPMMLRNTAAVADGILINASHPLDFKIAVETIREGAEKAGRTLQELDIGAYTACSVADSLEEASSGMIRVVVAYIVAGAPESVLLRHELELDRCKDIKEALAKGNYGNAQQLVSDQMIEAFAIVGRPDDCVQRIKELIDTGVTHFIAGSPIGPDKIKAIKILGQKVIPHFRE
ncbi:5,10-methylenetetrahydromethanopterin reductase [Candidatus Thorarchaeota archaeon]|nr:MAG: 5,10-methylenetetrahydromethanopterin reductase [Candidatus Thorarchaeota archaeon]